LVIRSASFGGKLALFNCHKTHSNEHKALPFRMSKNASKNPKAIPFCFSKLLVLGRETK